MRAAAVALSARAAHDDMYHTTLRVACDDACGARGERAREGGKRELKFGLEIGFWGLVKMVCFAVWS